MTKTVTVPYGTAQISMELGERSKTERAAKSAISIAVAGQTFAEGEKIPVSLFENQAAMLTLQGEDRGEQASADYAFSLKIGDKPAQGGQGTGGEGGSTSDGTTGGTGADQSGSNDGSAATGDDSMVWLMAAAMAMAATAAGATAFVRRRSN